MTLAGGSGTGATAVATVAGGIVTGITITNPGVGYTSVPTFTFTGGGSGASVATGTAAVSANASGGLTFQGAGTTTLSGTNTYTGANNINAGIVSIAADANLGASAASVSLNGGTVKTTAGITNMHAFTIGASGGTINVTTNAQYYFNTTNALTGSGTLTVTGTGTLTAGVGNLRLDHTNTYSGNLILNSGGSFDIVAATLIASGAPITIGSQGEFASQTGVTMPNNITVTGGTNSYISFENGNTGVISGNVTLNANAVIGLRDWYNYANQRSGTISGAISGAGGLTTGSGDGQRRGRAHADGRQHLQRRHHRQRRQHACRRRPRAGRRNCECRRLRRPGGESESGSVGLSAIYFSDGSTAAPTQSNYTGSLGTLIGSLATKTIATGNTTTTLNLTSTAGQLRQSNSFPNVNGNESEPGKS